MAIDTNKIKLPEKYKTKGKDWVASKARFLEAREAGLTIAVANGKIPQEQLDKIKNNKDTFFKDVGLI